MFDAEYFEKHIIKQFKELGEATVYIHLHDGTIFSVKTYSTEAGYLLLEVFPPSGVHQQSKEKRRKPGGTDEVFYDRVAISYDSVAYVVLTIVDPELPTNLGF